MRDEHPEGISYQINVSVVKAAREDGYAGILTVIQLPQMSEVSRADSPLRGRFFRKPSQALAAAVMEGQRIIRAAQRASG